MTTTRSNRVRIPLRPGNMFLVYWAGEPRMVAVDTEDGELILRDLGEAEAEALAAKEGQSP